LHVTHGAGILRSMIDRQATHGWTLLSLLKWSTSYLEERGFDEARLHVELLLCRVLNLSRVALYLNFDRPLTADELAGFRAMFTRRIAHEPLQYILGDTEFMGITLAVGPGVLIPRPETEQLVEEVLAAIRERRDLSILDIGTGSGNIPIAINHFSGLPVISIDVSQEALTLAEGNIRRLGLRGITLVKGDIFDDVLPGEVFDVIVSNPPYIPKADMQALQPEVQLHEPSIATTDGADGLTCIRRICAFSVRRLRPGGMLFAEIGYGQSEAVREIIRDAGLTLVDIVRDHSGIPRVVKAQRAV
jgi:release factor glutamine methyltransferase